MRRFKLSQLFRLTLEEARHFFPPKLVTKDNRRTVEAAPMQLSTLLDQPRPFKRSNNQSLSQLKTMEEYSASSSGQASTEVLTLGTKLFRDKTQISILSKSFSQGRLSASRGLSCCSNNQQRSKPSIIQSRLLAEPHRTPSMASSHPRC